MSQLRITSNQENHDHIAYIKSAVEYADQNGEGLIGYTSNENGHAHEIRYVSAKPPIIDPETQQVIQPAKKAEIIVMPAGKNGHVHTLEELLDIDDKKRRENSTTKDDEKDRLDEYLDIYLDSKSADTFYRNQAEECEAAYFGDGQWDSQTKRDLNEQSRPTLTINKLYPKGKALLGYESQNSTIPKFMPTEDGDQAVSDIFNTLTIHTLAVNDFKSTKNEVFEDIVVTGRGNYLLTVDYTKNLEGDIVIERAPWQDCLYLEHDKKNTEDCEGVVFSRWISEGKLKLLAPKEKLKELEDLGFFSNTRYQKGASLINFETEGLLDQRTKQIRLVQVQKKEFHTRTAIGNLNDDFYLDGMEGRVPGWLLDKKTQDRILSIPEFKKFERIVEEIWVGVFACNVLLFDSLSPFSHFTLIPGYASKRKHKVKGKIYDLLDAQREINKRRSTISDLASKLSSSGSYYDGETFEDEAQKQNYLDLRSTPGFAIEVADLEKRPVRENAVPLPTDLLMLEQQSTNDLNEISGINEELLGANSSANSARLYNERRNSALIGNEYLFNGLASADKLLAKRLLEAYKIVLTPDRVYRILENSNKQLTSQGGLKINNINFERYSPDEIKKIWEVADIAKYDIAVGDTEHSLTKREASLSMWVDLAKQGVSVPPQLILELSDSAPEQKQKLLEMTQQEQQQAMAIEAKKLSIEESKTQLAAQSREKIELLKIQSNERIELAKLDLKAAELKQSIQDKEKAVSEIDENIS